MDLGNGPGLCTFPSPTATPTAATASYPQNAFQTPKTSSFDSHFRDAFTTPRMPSPTLRSPAFAPVTPVQSQQSTSDVLRDGYHAHMQASVGASSIPAILPPSQAGYEPRTTSPVLEKGHMMSADSAQAMAYAATIQMQTPPPTRGTHVKRAQPQHMAFGTTSPDVYGLGNFGPASAPACSHTQLLWDQTTSNPHIYQQQQPRPTLDDPFAPDSPPQMPWCDSTTTPEMQGSVSPVSFSTPAMTSFALQAAVQRPSSADTTASVDPSLVYSSPAQPVQLRKVPESKPPKVRGRVYQSVANREDGATVQQKSSQPDHNRSETAATADSVSATAAASLCASAAPGPSLHRSKTTDTTRPPLAQSAIGIEPFSRTSSVPPVPRKTSPLKRVGVGSALLGTISEARKCPPSVVLTVDDSGRARVVCTPAPCPEDSPTRAMRSRYPGLFDSDSSDAESEEEKDAPSKTSSFSFSRGQERLPKAAKLDPSFENLKALSIPRSSSASLKVAPSRAAIAAAAQFRRGGSLRKPAPSRHRQRRIASTAAPSIDTAPMHVTQDRLESVMGLDDSTRGLGLSFSSEMDIHNHHWGIMSLEQQQAASPTRPPPQPFSDMHMPPPAPRRQVRCACGVNDEGGQAMVQCQTCTQWCHIACVVSPGAPMPTNFTCVLCAKPITRPSVGNTGNRKRS